MKIKNNKFWILEIELFQIGNAHGQIVSNMLQLKNQEINNIK